MILNRAESNSTHKFIKEIYYKLFGVTDYTPLGSDRSGVCGGNVAVFASEDVFDYPSFIRNTGSTDGTINYTDEYGNVVAGYPLKSGESTDFRVNKVTATSCTGLYRTYAQ